MRYLPFLLVPLLLTGCVEQIKESRVKSALTDGGLSETLSACMAHRMAQKLTIKQLHSLQNVKRAPHQTITEFVTALRQKGDPEAVEVATSSAVLCKSGLSR